MHRLPLLLAVLASVLLFSTAAAAVPGVPPFPRLPGNWSHAEINVTIRRQPHTLILDRGRITQVSVSQVTLRERTGTVVVVPLSQQVVVVVNGVRSSVYALTKRMVAQTMSIDGGAAVRVRAIS